MGTAVLRAMESPAAMKVWHLDPFSLTPYYDMALCAALEQEGCAVRYIASPFLYDSALPTALTDYLYFHSLNHPRWLRYPHLRWMVRLALYPFGHRTLLRQLDCDPPDIIHLQWSRIPKLDRWLIAQIHRHGIPVIYTIHDVEPLFSAAQVADLAKLYTEVDRLIVHTTANHMTLLKRQPDLQDRVSVIPHIALNWPTPLNATQASTRQQFGVPVNAVVLLFFGSIRAYKGLELLINAYLRVQASLPNLWLIVAGRPDHRHWRSVLQRLGNHILVHLEYVPLGEVWRYHLAADIAIIPYRQVSQSGALITAMGFGLPTIVTDVGGLPETIENSGWIVPPDDPAALARAIQDAASNPERLKQMGQRAKQIIAERHLPQQVARRTLAIYEHTLCSESST